MFDFLGNMPPLSNYVGPMLIALSGMLGVLGLFQALTRRRNLIESSDEWRDSPPVLYRLYKPVLKIFAPEVRKFMSDDSYNKLSQRLSAAGMSYAILPHEFVTMRFLVLVTASVCSFMLFRSPIEKGSLVMMFCVALPPMGFLWPDMWLRDQVASRRRSASREFPFLLDLLVLSMRAGLNYSGALSQAIGAMPPGPIREEFGKLLREIRAGKARRDALIDLAHRMDSEAINNFVAAINQAEETGGEIVDVLMAQAAQKRNERFNSAEAAANRAPIRMLLPMMAFLFPIIFLLMAFVIVVKLAEIGYLPESMVALLQQRE
jgi:tight adherence protein C